MRTATGNGGRWPGLAVAGLCLAALVASCTTTQQVPVRRTATCGFLGSDCSRLTQGAEGQFQLRYVNPDANWTQYSKVLIDPVTFWSSDTTKVSASDQQTLTDYFYQVLREQFGKKFQLVDQVGPGVMRIQVAITDAEAATPGLRTISMIVPQARTLNTLKYVATGTYAFIGGAQAEAKLIDAATGQVLFAALDRRVGGGSLKAAAQWEWGDAENAMNAWAEQASNRLYSWTSGAAKPS